MSTRRRLHATCSADLPCIHPGFEAIGFERGSIPAQLANMQAYPHVEAVIARHRLHVRARIGHACSAVSSAQVSPPSPQPRIPAGASQRRRPEHGYRVTHYKPHHQFAGGYCPRYRHHAPPPLLQQPSAFRSAMQPDASSQDTADTRLQRIQSPHTRPVHT